MSPVLTKKAREYAVREALWYATHGGLARLDDRLIYRRYVRICDVAPSVSYRNTTFISPNASRATRRQLARPRRRHGQLSLLYIPGFKGIAGTFDYALSDAYWLSSELVVTRTVWPKDYSTAWHVFRFYGAWPLGGFSPVPLLDPEVAAAAELAREAQGGLAALAKL